MALKIVTKKRYISNVQKIAAWLSDNFGKKVSGEFVLIVENKLLLLSNECKLPV